jgi:hypothetical protein
MVHALQPGLEPISDLAAYRLSARMRNRPGAPASPPARSVGQELREQRERNGKKLDDVWHELRIRPDYLTAIEEGRFKDLPGRGFALGYVSRYARYLGLDIERLSERLEAEIGAPDESLNHRVELEPVPERKFPFVRVVVAVCLLLAALAYSRDDIVVLATRAFEQATQEGQKGVEDEVAAAEQLNALPFEVGSAQPVSVRPGPLPPIPVVAVTQPRTVRFALLPPLPVIAVTQPRSVRPELLPALPEIAVTLPRSVRPELLPALPELAVTQPRSVRPELLPPLPEIAVTQLRSVRFELLPPLPVVAATEPRSVRFELLPALPVIAATEPRSVRFELLPPIPQIAVTQQVSLRADLAPAAVRQEVIAAAVPVPTEISVTPSASLRAELLPPTIQAQLPPGRRYGLQNQNSRITLRVHRPTIVAIRDVRNRVFIDRRLAPGDTYRVPNLSALWLTAIDAGAVEIVLDGASVGFAGAQGAEVRDLSLNPQVIANRAGAPAERL